MRKVCNLICFSILSLLISHAKAQKLSPDSPEFKQILAMGYEIHSQDKDYKETTVFTNGGDLLSVNKNDARVAVSRTFSRKKLDATQESILLSYVNKINTESTYQVSVSDEGITFALYLFGPYNSRALAMVVRLIERTSSAFDSRPEVLKLLND
jgi:hypothetical protein